MTVVETDHVPEVGQLLAPGPLHVFRVVLTLHVLFHAEYHAEVFAEHVDFEEVQKKGARQRRVERPMNAFVR